MMREDLIKLEELLVGNETFALKNYTFRDEKNGYVEIYKFTTIDKRYDFLDIFVYDYADSDSDETWECYKNTRAQLATEALSLQKEIDQNPIINEDFETKKLFEKYRMQLNASINQSQSNNHIIWGINLFYWRHFKQIFKKDDIFPLKEMTFENLICYVPNEYEFLLETFYKTPLALPFDMFSHQHFRLNDSEIQAMKDFCEKYSYILNEKG